MNKKITTDTICEVVGKLATEDILQIDEVLRTITGMLPSFGYFLLNI